MDIQRPESVLKQKKLRRLIYGAVVVAAVVAVSVGLAQLKPAAPTVDKSTVWVDTVKRGPMVRQVRGLGTLVPEDIRWIPVLTDARVDELVLRPGAVVKPDSIILKLSNPDLEQATEDATLQRKGAEADLLNTKAKLESDLLTQRATAATVYSDYEQAKLDLEKKELLNKDGLVSDMDLKVAQFKAQELAKRNQIEVDRVETQKKAAEAQIATSMAKVDQLRALEALKRKQMDALNVRAGINGILELEPVEVGQRVTAGTNVARVADPTRLKAQIRIAETQAKDVQIGQLAQVDTRNGVVDGKVSRIDPSVVNGTVTVDVIFSSPLPPGARADLTVDGTIELERMADVLYVGRPAFGQELSTVGLFKLTDNGQYATRVQVKLGRSSVNTIEIQGGLQPGDQVILSDMSAWDRFDRIQLR
ncbi:MAG TPA: HlyD family efflux transporter periplasmic adaptor subunit [Candidatus Acidoferrales bacterium]|nr:HlyD family efflux transporter periplasmic adaptor subunit [Candidatus Acidoferrales bacterium]